MRVMYGYGVILNLFTHIFHASQLGKIKRRWVGIVGGYDAGKSTIAAAFKTLFKGCSPNINLRDDTRRGFQLGLATGRRFVVFDDVTPVGISVLNTKMRDFLDGHITVQLERKNRDVMEQIFPPGIITTNVIDWPEALKKRIHFVTLTSQPEFHKAHIKYFEETEYDVKFDKMGIVVLFHLLGGLDLEGLSTSRLANICRDLQQRYAADHDAKCQYCANIDTENFSVTATRGTIRPSPFTVAHPTNDAGPYSDDLIEKAFKIARILRKRELTAIHESTPTEDAGSGPGAETQCSGPLHTNQEPVPGPSTGLVLV